MDAHQRDLIRDLHAEFMRSVTEATKYSKAWVRRSATLSQKYGNDTAEAYIAARDDMRLQEYMGSYSWHRDNAGFCVGAINLLLNEAVNQIVGRGIPSQREQSARG